MVRVCESFFSSWRKIIKDILYKEFAKISLAKEKMQVAKDLPKNLAKVLPISLAKEKN